MNGLDTPPPPMRRALDLAKHATGLTEPNPRVGCVLIARDGGLLGEGHTQRAGQAHAEIMALRDAESRGNSVRGATAFVTLEPCSHHGRTGPCCDALIAAGVARIVASTRDPNPQVAGQGFERLRAAGIDVETGEGAAESRELNLGFFSRMQRQLPWVRLKIAASLDGTTALNNGSSQWITSPEARADGHAWRARASFVLTGVGTVQDDDPSLDVRLVPCERQPGLVIVDSELRTPPAARLFAATRRPVLIYCANPEPAARSALEARGATVIAMPGGGRSGRKVDLRAMLADLARRECNELHVEAGTKLNGSLLREGLVDELLLYQAPRLLGPGLGLAQLDPLESLEKDVRLDFLSATMTGPDLRVLARVQGHDRF